VVGHSTGPWDVGRPGNQIIVLGMMQNTGLSPLSRVHGTVSQILYRPAPIAGRAGQALILSSMRCWRLVSAPVERELGMQIHAALGSKTPPRLVCGTMRIPRDRPGHGSRGWEDRFSTLPSR